MAKGKQSTKPGLAPRATKADKATKDDHWESPQTHSPAPPGQRRSRRWGFRCCRYIAILTLFGFVSCAVLLRASFWIQRLQELTLPADGSIKYHHRYQTEDTHGNSQEFYNGYRGRHIIGQDTEAGSKVAGSSSSTPKAASGHQYLLGVGKADITGPIVEINMMGYAKSQQVGSGVRQRLYSRAFIVGDTQNPDDRFIYLVLDTQSGDTAVRYGILSSLKKLGPSYSMYGQDNLAVSGTHSHSGPGAWVNYLLPQITSKGFDQQSYRAIVDGCVLSIRRAHESLGPGYLSSGSIKVLGASINRSLFSYLNNPEEERARYNISSEDDGSVDKELTMLKFQRASDGKNIGVLTWFPTHGTSMKANNTLITGDNKGVAADLFEKHVRGGPLESADFVAGFSQANMGDATPNTLGAWCEDGSGERCDLKTSTCSDNTTRSCHARGPGFREPDFGATSCFEIGKRQYEGALEVYKSMVDKPANIGGAGVKAVHKFHDMAYFEFRLSNGSIGKTCPAALGYSFAAGTWDEPGVRGICQHGSNSSNSPWIWNFISQTFYVPDQTQIECQYPKPIILDVGEVTRPYEWTPNVVDIQTFRVGQFFIIVSPGEATTMAGRRWKEAVAKSSLSTLGSELGGREPIVVLGAPSNSYTHYITTEEEYRIQRYEGASTLYGPHTLEAHINQSLGLLPFLRNHNVPERAGHLDGPLPPDNSDDSLSFINGVLYDGAPWGKQFGHVHSDVKQEIYVQGESVTATFVGANPRNDLKLERTFAAVEFRHAPGDEWKLARDDSDWGVIFRWRRTSIVLGYSEVEIEWKIEEWTQPGEYRLRYFGDSKSWRGQVSAFDGVSKAFRVG